MNIIYRIPFQQKKERGRGGAAFLKDKIGKIMFDRQLLNMKLIISKFQADFMQLAVDLVLQKDSFFSKYIIANFTIFSTIHNV